MNIREAITYGAKKCDLLDAQLLLAHVLGVERLFILTHDDTLTIEQQTEFERLLELRVSHHPLQYILGKCEFYGLEFEVAEGVLIPRADTETLVDAVINEKGRLLEIGTGSGCVAISLAKNNPKLVVDAIDISEPALEIARRNAKKHGANVNFIHADIFEWKFDSVYDIIVSNPPYIETDVIPTLQPEVANFEPRTALDGGVDGLDFYRKIAQIPVGKLTAVELGHTQFDAVAEIFADCGFEQIEARCDLAGIKRVLIASY